MAVTNTTIDMTWTAATDNVGVVSYHIYQSTDNVVYTEIHSTDGATYAYTAIGLSEGTKYYFKQTAKDAAGNESLYGNTVEATTLGEVGYTYILDDYPGAAAAYSLRKLRTGVVNAVEVRRDNDNATTNVLLYDDPSKSIDLLSTVEAGGTLGDWVGSASAFVFSFYDQSGSGNDTLQNIEAEQPRLINNGVLEVDNGLSALWFDGIDDSLLVDKSLIPLNKLDIFAVQTTYSDNIVCYHDPNSAQRWFFIMQSGSTNTTTSQNFIIDNVYKNSNIQSFSNRGDWYNAFSSQRSLLTIFGQVNTFTWNQFQINGYEDFESRLKLQEIIIYNSDQSSNRVGIETNINNNYNIFLVTADVDAQLIQADNDNVSDTIIEINGVRSSASDTAVANLISRNVTVITN